MGKFVLKPERVIVAEMMSRGVSYGIMGIGSNDPGPEITGRAHLAVRYAIARGDEVFKYEDAGYPFAQSNASQHYRDSFSIKMMPTRVRVTNSAPSALFAEKGRPAISGRRMAIPIKTSHVASFGGRKFLYTMRVAAADGHDIISVAIRKAYAR